MIFPYKKQQKLFQPGKQSCVSTVPFNVEHEVWNCHDGGGGKKWNFAIRDKKTKTFERFLQQAQYITYNAKQGF